MSNNNNNHPITLPPDLVQQWIDEEDGVFAEHLRLVSHELRRIATQAARWGADQELKACIQFLDVNGCPGKFIDLLRCRRPKPPSLKEQALEALEQVDRCAVTDMRHLNIHTELAESVRTIRHALLRLDG